MKDLKPAKIPFLRNRADIRCFDAQGKVSAELTDEGMHRRCLGSPFGRAVAAGD